MKSFFVSATAVAAMLLGSSAYADPVSVDILVKPEKEMKYQFGDGSKHFILALQRQGEAKGTGVFAGTTVTEVGWHDVNPPISGHPRGYLEFTADNGDVAVVSWTVEAVFTKGKDGPALLDKGVWELVSGTGQFEEKRGVGSLVIKPQGGPALYMLEGDVGDAP